MWFGKFLLDSYLLLQFFLKFQNKAVIRKSSLSACPQYDDDTLLTYHCRAYASLVISVVAKWWRTLRWVQLDHTLPELLPIERPNFCEDNLLVAKLISTQWEFVYGNSGQEIYRTEGKTNTWLYLVWCLKVWGQNLILTICRIINTMSSWQVVGVHCLRRDLPQRNCSIFWPPGMGIHEFQVSVNDDFPLFLLYTQYSILLHGFFSAYMSKAI